RSSFALPPARRPLGEVAMKSTYTVDSGQRVPIKMWTAGVPVEDGAMQQLRNVAALPFVHSHVAVMPDVHWGMGATVGSVIPTKGAIVPAAVGVDIGCGMAAVRLDGARAEHLPDSLVQLRSELEHTIPVGFGVHKADKWNVNAVAPRLKALEQFVAG